ncbi:hypothetical protein [Serinibacter arcticus]|jgi:hypothetical protein|uniref:Small integral membrane protein n=1 Tax=Serinibacter arcticus TaxID=1655435 RepID=A0A4Z1E1B1_9MICO|nr:hypothetical protein [Serinibacter arcticus]TGO05646.1 hypothetical protein SERN_1650 [Serinibacter arcticus]
MSRTNLGLAVGLVLGLTAAFGSFAAFITVLAFGAVGLIVGLALDGRVDVQGMLGRASEKR